MPQYNRTQYGLKQYGTFIPVKQPESSARYQFVRARFGVRKKGKTFWLYQHRAVSVPGRPERLRLRTNTGDSILEDQITVPGRCQAVRIRTNTKQTLISETIENR